MPFYDETEAQRGKPARSHSAWDTLHPCGPAGLLVSRTLLPATSLQGGSRKAERTKTPPYPIRGMWPLWRSLHWRRPLCLSERTFSLVRAHSFLQTLSRPRCQDLREEMSGVEKELLPWSSPGLDAIALSPPQVVGGGPLTLGARVHRALLGHQRCGEST